MQASRMQWGDHLRLWGAALVPVLVVMGCGVAPALPFLATLQVAPITATWLSLPFIMFPTGLLYWQFKDQPHVPKRWTWQDGLLIGCAFAPLCWLLLAAFVSSMSWPLVFVLATVAMPVGGAFLAGSFELIESTFPSLFPPLENQPMDGLGKPVNPVLALNAPIAQGLLALAERASLVTNPPDETKAFWSNVNTQLGGEALLAIVKKEDGVLDKVRQLAQAAGQAEIVDKIDEATRLDWSMSADDDPADATADKTPSTA